MRRLPFLLGTALLLAGASACDSSDPTRTTPEQRAAIADTLRRLVTNAYDFSRADVVSGLMSLYPDSGRVISATAGRVLASRADLERDIRYFWNSTGTNMQDPRLEWGTMYVDVLTPAAAVATWSYRIPHRTPAGAPHVVGGAWTALFVKRDGRWMIVQEHLSDAPAP